MYLNLEAMAMAVLVSAILQDFYLKSDSMTGGNLWRKEASASIIYYLKNIKEGLYFNVCNSLTNNKVHHHVVWLPEWWWHLAVCWLHVHKSINKEGQAAALCIHSSWTLHRCLLQLCAKSRSCQLENSYWSWNIWLKAWWNTWHKFSKGLSCAFKLIQVLVFLLTKRYSACHKVLLSYHKPTWVFFPSSLDLHWASMTEGGIVFYSLILHIKERINSSYHC